MTPEQFWTRVDASGDCWEWTGRRRSGYGVAELVGTTSAHRVAYVLLVGPIPEGLQLDHLCRNRACVNPDHLEPVTNLVNSRRALWRHHCRKGHPLTPENTYWRPTPRKGLGPRQCAICHIESARRSQARQRAAAA